MDFETSLLQGLDKESLGILATKVRKSFEDKIILINTYIDILEYNNAGRLLHLVRTSIKKDKKNRALNDLILTYLENKILLITDDYQTILLNLDYFDLTNYKHLEPKERTFLLLILFLKAESKVRTSKYANAEKDLNLVLSTLEYSDKYRSTLPNDVIYGLYYRLSFINNYFVGATEKAAYAVYHGLDIYTKTNNVIYLAYFYNFYGIIAGMKGDYNKSLEYYKKSLDYFASIGTEDATFRINYIAKIYNNMAIILREQGKLQEAIRLIKDSIDIFEQNKIQTSLAILYDSLGIFYTDLREFDLANTYLYKAYDLRRETSDPLELSESLVHICILEEKTGKLASNTISIREFPEKIDGNLVLLNKLIIEGLVSLSQKDYDNALKKLNEAFTLEGVDFSDRLLIIDYKADIYLEKNDFKNFSEHLKIWKILAKENNLLPSLFKAYMIDFRFELLFLNFESAKKSIDEASKLAKNYSLGALKLVEENMKLLKSRGYLMNKAQDNDNQKLENIVKEQELMEIKKYINEITSFITKFDETVH